MSASSYRLPPPKAVSRREFIEQMLKEHPEQSNRAIAIEAGCNLSWVCSIRREVEYRRLGQMPTPGIVHVARVGRSLASRLGILTQRVREGKDVENASEFARWITGSGVLELLESASLAEGKAARAAAKMLEEDCMERWRTGNTAPALQLEDVRSLQERVAALETKAKAA